MNLQLIKLASSAYNSLVKAITKIIDSQQQAGFRLTNDDLWKLFKQDPKAFTKLLDDATGGGAGPGDAASLLGLADDIPSELVAKALAGEKGLVGLAKGPATAADILGVGGIGGKMINPWTRTPGSGA
tara:strand:- start:49 stop:432 length:384 start_codon:yes stop_codon:yes gene_type:complete